MGEPWIAAAAALLMIAEHVAGKALRDAFFLSTFGVGALPGMFIAAAAASIAVVPLLSRLLRRHGPMRIVPPAFALSGVLLLASAWLAEVAPRVAAVAVYLQIAAVNAVLVSWFWSLVNERFDPRTAKREMRRMVGGAALGGLVGGVLAERTAGLLGSGAMLLVLAGLHGLCALATARLSRDRRPAPPIEELSGLAVLRQSSHARRLALLVVLGTVCATLLDYLFKAQAVAVHGEGAPLLRFFAVFHAATGLATFLLSSLLGHAMLVRFGIARTVATLPGTVIVGGIAALVVPGMPAFTLLRGAEIALHGSLYRSGYELFFTPMSPAEKRGVKTLIDVGFERFGDALGGAILAVVLAVAVATTSTLLVFAIAVAAAIVLLAVELHHGYVRTLERRLRERAVAVDLTLVQDSTTLSVIRSFDRVAPAPSAPIHRAGVPSDPVVERIVALRSRDPEVVRAALAEPLSAPLVGHAIPLLAWDDVATAAITALGRHADAFAGQLVDALLDPDQEFAVRRRIARVLELGASPRIVEGLVAGLADPRFEVRYRCGRALTRIHTRAPEQPIDRDKIFAAVRAEAALDRGVWDSQRLLDDPPAEGFVEPRSRSLEHVFTLLSLAFPGQPLVEAFRGLRSDDPHLRGTALEYLEGILPPDVREGLWGVLEG